MRNKVTDQGLTVQAIAGTHVVLLGFNIDQADCDGLMGFAIHRTDHKEEEASWLKGLKTFEETDPGFPPGVNIRHAAILSRGLTGQTSQPNPDTITPTEYSR